MVFRFSGFFHGDGQTSFTVDSGAGVALAMVLLGLFLNTLTNFFIWRQFGLIPDPLSNLTNPCPMARGLCAFLVLFVFHAQLLVYIFLFHKLSCICYSHRLLLPVYLTPTTSRTKEIPKVSSHFLNFATIWYCSVDFSCTNSL